LPPSGDPRTPDILVTPNVGVTYSGSSKKLAEHGGFAHDDVNVIMLLSNPRFSAKTVTTPVRRCKLPPPSLQPWASIRTACRLFKKKGLSFCLSLISTTGSD